MYDKDAYLDRIAALDAQVLGDLGLTSSPDYLRHHDEEMFCNYPLLFAGAFCGCDEAELATLAVAARWVGQHVLYLDKVIDCQVAPSAELYLHHALFLKSLDLLRRLYPVGHAFWHHFWMYYNQYLHTRHAHKPLPGSPDGEQYFRAEAAGSIALAKFVPTAMALSSGLSQWIEPFNRSLEALYTGFQLYDDLVDWKDDVRRGKVSWLLWRVLSARNEQHLTSRIVAIPQYAVTLHRSRLSFQSLDEAEAYYHQAIAEVKALPTNAWVEFAESQLKRTTALRADLESILTLKV
jgi:hypothetical protein